MIIRVNLSIIICVSLNPQGQTKHQRNKATKSNQHNQTKPIHPNGFTDFPIHQKNEKNQDTWKVQDSWPFLHHFPKRVVFELHPMLVKSTRSEGHTSHSLKKSSSLVLFFEGETTGGEKTKGEDQVLYIYIYISNYLSITSTSSTSSSSSSSQDDSWNQTENMHRSIRTYINMWKRISAKQIEAIFRNINSA